MRMHRLPHVVTGVILNPLSLSTPTVIEHTSAGVVVGTLSNMTGGSTLSITNTAGSRFALSGNNIVTGATATDYATATSQTITIRETLAGAVNTPLDSNIVISVTAGSFATPVITMTSTTGTNPPTWSSVMTDLQVGDSVQLDFTSNGSAPDGTAEETHSPVTSDEAINGAITWTTFTGFAGSSTVKWRVRYGRGGIWSAWSNTLSDTMAAATFAPSSLYGVGDIGYAWDTTDGTHIWQSNAGSTAGAFASVVGRIDDKSGLGNNLNSEANDATRPIWTNSNNGVLAFQETNSTHLKGIGGFWTKGVMTMILFISGSAANTNCIWAEDSTAVTGPVYSPGLRGSSATQMLNYERNDVSTALVTAMNAAILNSSPHIYMIEDTGTQLTLWVDGVQTATAAYTRLTGMTAPNASFFGTASAAGSLFAQWTGNIGSGVLISRQLTGTLGTAGTEKTKAYNWIAAKHGLTTL